MAQILCNKSESFEIILLHKIEFDLPTNLKSTVGMSEKMCVSAHTYNSAPVTSVNVILADLYFS